MIISNFELLIPFEQFLSLSAAELIDLINTIDLDEAQRIRLESSCNRWLLRHKENRKHDNAHLLEKIELERCISEMAQDK